MRNYYRDKTEYILAGVIAGIGCIIMVLFPVIALNATQKGVSLWASSVLPALLPFFICANFMTALGFPILVGKIFEKPFRKIFGSPGASAFIFSISITSGYPMGAKLIGDMGRRNEITKAEAKRMLTFCSTSGPLFMLGAVGAGMLISPAAGAVIAIAHYLGAILNGILFRFLSPTNGWDRKEKKGKGFQEYHSEKIKNHYNLKVPKDTILEIFTDSIVSSFKALGIICGYIVLFTLITDFIQFSGVLNGVDSPIIKGMIKGFFEMTIGCNSIAMIPNLSLSMKCIICAVIISWGGLSIFAQSMSMLSGLDISPWYYIFVKLIHGALSGFVAFLISPMILERNVINTGTFNSPQVVERLGSIYSLLFSTKMVIMVIVIFMILVFIENRLQHFKTRRSIDESTRDNRGI